MFRGERKVVLLSLAIWVGVISEAHLKFVEFPVEIEAVCCLLSREILFPYEVVEEAGSHTCPSYCSMSDLIASLNRPIGDIDDILIP
jgi:hypothetical protein